MKKNKGIIISGANFKAENIAVGKKSKIKQTISSKKNKEEKDILHENKGLNDNEEAIVIPSVFISYNHHDRDIAIKISETLLAAHVDVTLDIDTMKAGENIKEFIENSVNDTNFTISIVSNKSLQSAWVAMETIQTFYHEKLGAKRRLIACFIDEDFFQPEFTLNTIEKIDAQIKTNQKLIPKYNQKMLDTRDLNNQNTRLLALRSNLDSIILRLRESLCLDVGKNKFNDSMKRLIEAIKN